MGDNGFPVVNYSIKPVCEEGCGTQQNKKEEGMKCPIGIMGGKLPQGVVPFEPLKVLFQG